VIVNDLGTAVDGEGRDAGPAEAVAAEICDSGGSARADFTDVTDSSAAAQLVRTTVQQFGRLDGVVANAGTVRWAGFPEVDAQNLAHHLEVHVGGAFHVTRAAWPQFVKQGYGRVVMTTSTGVFGLPDNTSYAAAKAAVIGLVRSAALAGGPKGIMVNAIAPAAMTRMAGGGGDDGSLRPEAVAPLVALLVHELCPVNGETYTAGGGRFGRLLLGSTDGWVADHSPTPEDVLAHWSAIQDPRSVLFPPDLLAWSRAFLEHLRS
jgi:NAD(P)-dependent dehydrogenase (short-subunit alcohol dehydrogenase family)